MDTLAHGLYGAAFFKKKRKLFWWALLIGMLPDILFIGYHELWEGKLYLFFLDALQINHSIQPSNTLYYITHSFITVGIVFLLLRLIRKNLSILTFPLALHILFDIPFHCGMYGTRFLYPISDISFCGYEYTDFSHAWVWPLNYLIIGLVYYSLQKREKRKERQKLMLENNNKNGT